MKRALALCALYVPLLAGLADSAESATATGVAVIALTRTATTSAGIFDSQGQLIRTLWSGEQRERGNVRIEWDGRDDDGHEVAAQGEYQVRILAHNLKYRWQGVIGNTSQDQVGTQVFRAYLPIHDMAFDDAGDGFYVVGYTERLDAMHRFNPVQPTRQEPLGHDDFRRLFRFVATDGDLVYFANEGLPAARSGEMQEETFVVALNVRDGAEHVFREGRHAGGPPESEWSSVIDYGDGMHDLRPRLPPTGLAVQRHGNALFIAHTGAGEIRVLDKRSGAQTARIAIAGAGDMSVAADDSLWVLCRTGIAGTVRHYQQRGGEWLQVGEIESGFREPMAIGVSRVDDTIVVADAASEQLKAFDSAGRPLWTLGRSGGYRQGGPEVSEDRFGFSAGPAYIAFQADGSFWFGDPINYRNLHYSAARRYLGQIMYLPHMRVTTVDVQDPTRVFAGFLEFKVDYAKPLASSWRLVRNWSAGLNQHYLDSDFAGLQTVQTLPGGHTLGVARRFDLNRNEIMELHPDGLRSAGTILDSDSRLYPDGSLRQHLIRGQTLRIYSRRLDSFDAEDHPRWAVPQLLAEVPALQHDDPYYHDVPFLPGINDATYPLTSSGTLVSFNPGSSQGYHLGGIDLQRGGWLWRASPSGRWELDASQNIVPRDGRYGLDPSVQYPGNIVTVAGRNIVFGYHGEGWQGGEADQWLHFYDDGLFVGQFGTPGPQRPAHQHRDAVAGFAGNAFTPQLVTVNGKVYLWHNDESGHSGIHRWLLEGADTIRELTAPISP